MQLSAIADAPTHKVSPIPMVAVWDLAAISVAADDNVIPDYAMRHADMTVEEIRALFSPTSNVPLCRLEGGVRKVYCVEVLPLRKGDGLAKEKVGELITAWLSDIINHPIAYLSHRTNLMLHLFDIYRDDRKVGFNIAHAQPAMLEQEWYNGPSLAIPPFAEQNIAGQAIRDTIIWLRDNTPLLSPWLYALLFAACAIINFRGRRDAFTNTSLLSALLMAGPLFVIAPNDQLRYLIWPIVATLIAALRLYSLRKHG